MRDEYTSSGWCCTDCVILLANGEDPADTMSEDEITAWHTDINRNTEGFNLTLGMLREEHECRTNYTVTFADRTSREVLADDANEALQSARCQYPRKRGLATAITRHELETNGDRGGDDFCETRSFSWDECDVCGSNLGGERHAVSFWKTLEG